MTEHRDTLTLFSVLIIIIAYNSHTYKPFIQAAQAARQKCGAFLYQIRVERKKNPPGFYSQVKPYIYCILLPLFYWYGVICWHK